MIPMISHPLLPLLILSVLFVCLLSGMPLASAAGSSIVWVQAQAYYDETHFLPDDEAWIEIPLLRSGDSGDTSRVTLGIADATISNGNKPGEYELLGENPVVFQPGSTYAVIKVRFHRPDHNVFGTQRLTFRLSDSDADIEADQAARTVYVDYPPMPSLAFLRPAAGELVGVEGQEKAVVIAVLKDNDPFVDAYADIYASGTATNGVDYTLADADGRPVGVPGTIRLPPGQSMYTIYMTLPADPDEGNETVTLTLGNPVNAAAGNLTGISVTILDAGHATPVLPSAPPVPSPSGSPSATPAATAGSPTRNSTPVPLPDPGFGPVVTLAAIAGMAIFLKARR
ncbi:MAG: hypothetical protein A4E28_03227 [Methanocella sp. PtaU1.Bin125]|nr:MAG: hypothetical protein A4E28_03227 [Methanocella sp. PtaU1.Bin125]